VMDGATVARILARLDQVLTRDFVAKLHALEKPGLESSPAGILA